MLRRHRKWVGVAGVLAALFVLGVALPWPGFMHTIPVALYYIAIGIALGVWL